MGVRILVGILLVGGLLVHPVFVWPDSIEEVLPIMIECRLYATTEEGDRELLARPTIMTLVNHPALFTVGTPIPPIGVRVAVPKGPGFSLRSEQESWQAGTQVDILVPAINDGQARVQVESRIGVVAGDEKEPELVQHVTTLKRAQFHAKIGEAKEIGLSNGQRLEVTIFERPPAVQIFPPDQDVKSPKAEVRVLHIDDEAEGTPLRSALEAKITLPLSQEVNLSGFTDQCHQMSDEMPGVTKTTTTEITNTIRLDEISGNRAAIEFIMTRNERSEEDSNDGPAEISRRVTEHRFTYRAQSGKTKLFKISEQQRVELTFTWE